ncbi:MAG: ABC transporter substrate-binding protein [Acidobacteria bacterium]|nr:ABC transporter substrate-binding protein [Acidobacteriota bacterium]
MPKTFLQVCMLLLMVAALIAGCRRPKAEGESVPARDDRIRIGAFMSLTGDTANFGISAANGIQLAVEQSNTGGGVLGKRIELIVQDTRSDTGETETVVQRLVGQYRVHALLGEVISSRSIVAASVAQAARIPMLTPSATSPEVTAKGDFIFRSCYTDPFQGAALAQFATDGLHATRAAMLLDAGQSYSIQLSNFIREAFIARGGQIVVQQNYTEGAGDFTTQLAVIRDAAPDVVFIPGYYRDAGLIVRQARRMKINTPFVGGDGWDSRGLYDTGGQDIAGSFFSSHYSADDPDPAVQQFVAEYRAIYGQPPDAFAATAYDAARIMIDALRHATTLDGPAVRDSLARMKNFPGVTGSITFNERRDAVKPIVIIKIGDAGRFTVQARITPEMVALPPSTSAPSNANKSPKIRKKASGRKTSTSPTRR